jgi:hypothetical protein
MGTGGFNAATSQGTLARIEPGGCSEGTNNTPITVVIKYIPSD